MIENAKSMIHNERSYIEILNSLHEYEDMKIPDFVYSSIIDTYMEEKNTSNALNILIHVN